MPNRYRRTVVLQRGRYIKSILVLKQDKTGWTTSFAQMRQTPNVSKPLAQDRAEELFEKQLAELQADNWAVISNEEDRW